MKVRALQLGEHPQGTWRQPGEVFTFEGKKKDLGKWMEPANAKDEREAEDAAKEEELEAAKAEAAKEAEAQAEADKKAELEEKAKAEAAKGEEVDDDPKFHTVHKGFGKWDVFAPSGEVVEGGDNLKKEAAHELVEKLNAELAAGSEE